MTDRRRRRRHTTSSSHRLLVHHVRRHRRSLVRWRRRHRRGRARRCRRRGRRRARRLHHPQHELRLKQCQRQLRILSQKRPRLRRVALLHLFHLRHDLIHLRRREIGDAFCQQIHRRTRRRHRPTLKRVRHPRRLRVLGVFRSDRRIRSHRSSRRRRHRFRPAARLRRLFPSSHRHRLRVIHPKRSSVVLSPVQISHRAHGCRVIVVLDEPVPAQLTAVSVRHQPQFAHWTSLGEEFTQRRLRRVVRNVPHEHRSRRHREVFVVRCGVLASLAFAFAFARG